MGMKTGILVVFLIAALLTNIVAANPGIIVEVGTPIQTSQPDGSTTIEYPLTIGNLDEGYDTDKDGSAIMDCCEKMLSNIEVDTTWDYDITPALDALIIPPGVDSYVNANLIITVPPGVTGTYSHTITTTTQLYNILLPYDLLFNWKPLTSLDEDNIKLNLKNNFGVVWAESAVVSQPSDNRIEVRDGTNLITLNLNNKKSKVTFSNGGNHYNFMAQDDGADITIWDVYTADHLPIGEDIDMTTFNMEIISGAPPPVPEAPTAVLLMISVLGLVCLVRRSK